MTAAFQGSYFKPLLPYLLVAIICQYGGCSEHPSSHTSNWAVLVATSKYWYNYRQVHHMLRCRAVVTAGTRPTTPV